MPKMRQGCLQGKGAGKVRSLARSEVGMVLFELSVRKTLEGRQCGCRDLALAMPNQHARCLGLASRLPAKPGPLRIHAG
jgi:hypothetical protein